MAATANIDGLRPLSQSELATLLRQRRAASLSTKRRQTAEINPVKSISSFQERPSSKRLQKKVTPVYHLRLENDTSQDLYVRKKVTPKPSPEVGIIHELHQLELWLPQLQTKMRQEVQFVRRSWFIGDGHVFAAYSAVVVAMIAVGYFAV